MTDYRRSPRSGVGERILPDETNSNDILAEVLKIIESEYINTIPDSLKSDVTSLHKALKYEGWNDALNQIKKRILSIGKRSEMCEANA